MYLNKINTRIQREINSFDARARMDCENDIFTPSYS